MVEANGTVLRGVVAENPKDRDIITVYVDGYSTPYEYQAGYVFRKESRAIAAAGETEL